MFSPVAAVPALAKPGDAADLDDDVARPRWSCHRAPAAMTGGDDTEHRTADDGRGAHLDAPDDDPARQVVRRGRCSGCGLTSDVRVGRCGRCPRRSSRSIPARTRPRPMLNGAAACRPTREVPVTFTGMENRGGAQPDDLDRSVGVRRGCGHTGDGHRPVPSRTVGHRGGHDAGVGRSIPVMVFALPAGSVAHRISDVLSGTLP